MHILSIRSGGVQHFIVLQPSFRSWGLPCLGILIYNYQSLFGASWSDMSLHQRDSIKLTLSSGLPRKVVLGRGEAVPKVPRAWNCAQGS
jgi:hypothetical protein